MYSAITYVHLCHPSLLHQTGMSPNYINFENTHKRPKATDAETDKTQNVIHQVLMLVKKEHHSCK